MGDNVACRTANAFVDHQLCCRRSLELGSGHSFAWLDHLLGAYQAIEFAALKKP